jgi:hypothetical protein
MLGVTRLERVMSIEQLLKTNVNEHTEKKANLTYLSWAWAWAEALKADPTATFTVQTFDECGPNGAKRTVPYMGINGTAMVWVTVTIFGKPMTCQLPVMDHRNKAIADPDAFQVNTAIMRCMTKALSLHGLGLYIYAGEDLPDEAEVPRKGPAPVVTPRGGIGEDLPNEIKEFLQEMADSITGLVKNGQAVNALAMIDEQALEADQKVYLHNQLDAPTRSALKKAKNG